MDKQQQFTNNKPILPAKSRKQFKNASLTDSWISRSCMNISSDRVASVFIDWIILERNNSTVTVESFEQTCRTVVTIAWRVNLNSHKERISIVSIAQSFKNLQTNLIHQWCYDWTECQGHIWNRVWWSIPFKDRHRHPSFFLRYLLSRWPHPWAQP